VMKFVSAISLWQSFLFPWFSLGWGSTGRNEGRGPDRIGVSSEKNKHFLASRPKVSLARRNWHGFFFFLSRSQRAEFYTMGNASNGPDFGAWMRHLNGKESVAAHLTCRTGATYYEGGRVQLPRSRPNRVLHITPGGDVPFFCLDAATGAVILAAGICRKEGIKTIGGAFWPARPVIWP